MNIELPVEKLKPIIQNLINGALDSIREESEEWGLGEMDELQEIESINKIVIDRIYNQANRIYVSVDVYTNSRRQVFDNVLSEIRYRTQEWVPQVVIIENEIVNDWSAGFGTEW